MPIIKAKLEEIAHLVSGVSFGNKELIATSVTASSLETNSKSIFVAISGEKIDGHTFIQSALDNGSPFIVTEKKEVLGVGDGILVKNSRIALSKLAAYFAGYPAKKLRTIAITGTNGKTTTNWILSSLLQSLGRKPLRIGTLGAYLPGEIEIDEGLTTPDPVTLHNLLARALNLGASDLVIEASSHALHQHRVDELDLSGAIFTNLSRDHLDYHLDMEDYFTSKAGLFNLLQESSKLQKIGVSNIDDAYGKRLLINPDIRSFGIADGATLKVISISESVSGTAFEFTYSGEKFKALMPLPGNFNTMNAAASLLLLSSLGHDMRELCEALEEISPVPGRFEKVDSKFLNVYVDYAHTPDALKNVLIAARRLTKGKVWTLIGCGGERDRGKRPQMAEAARELSDVLVISSDNPRSEDPGLIIADMLAGGVKADIVESDRRVAINAAIDGMAKEDLLIIAGRGHERYMKQAGELIPFLDSQVAQIAISKRESTA